MIRRYLAWRARVLTDERRACIGRWTVRLALAVMVVGWLASTIAGQSQDVSIARLEERMASQTIRVDDLREQLRSIDQRLWAGLIGIAALLAERAIQWKRSR